MAYSNATFQAVSILLYIHFKIEEEEYDYLSNRIISEMLGIPVPTVVKIMGKLVAAGMIETKEGVRGGSILLRPISEISMLDVFNAVEQGKPLFKIQHNFKIEYDGLEDIINKGASCLLNAEKEMQYSLKKVKLSSLIS